MGSQNTSSSLPDTGINAKKAVYVAANVSGDPSGPRGKIRSSVSLFWRNRLIEAGLILSMALYYIVGNEKLYIGKHPLLPQHFWLIFARYPLLSLPFLFIFAVLSWYRLPVAVALLPLSLPYYLLQKIVFSHYAFSPAEITLWTCVGVAALQLVLQRQRWRYWLPRVELRNRLGPFIWPVLLFFLMAALSVAIAYSHVIALRAFREEVFDPLVYVLLALACLRTRQDVTRLLAALLGTGLVIAVLGLIQFFFMKSTLVLESDGIRRVHTVYGSANSIGLLFDYVLPLAFAWLLAKVSLQSRLVALILCIPMLIVLYLTQSLGAEIGISAAFLFVVACSIRNRRLLMLGSIVLLAAAAVVLLVFYKPLFHYLIDRHQGVHGVGSLTKRIYLWETAWRMIRAHPVFGVGMENWLCHYSYNNICGKPLYHYWIEKTATGASTGLSNEPNLSHPHNIFLQVWVSIGIFGLLAFLAVLVLFYRLFARVLVGLSKASFEGREHVRWMTVGVGAAMAAALVQGLGDSSFLEQDLAFCFWILVTALLLLRVFADVPWWNSPFKKTKL